MSITLVFYKEDDGTIPVMEFFEKIPELVRLKLIARLELLESLGHLLRRPHCDYLGEGVYELRVRQVKTQYRLLYFFYKKEFVVISHGFTKEQKIPPIEIMRARSRATKFTANPQKHSYFEVYRGYE